MSNDVDRFVDWLRLNDELEEVRADLRAARDDNARLRSELEQLKVGLVPICGMAHNDRRDERVLEVRPRDDVMPGAFIAKLKRPR